MQVPGLRLPGSGCGPALGTELLWKASVRGFEEPGTGRRPGGGAQGWRGGPHLGLGRLSAAEHEEGIAGTQQGAGQVQQ